MIPVQVSGVLAVLHWGFGIKVNDFIKFLSNF